MRPSAIPLYNETTSIISKKCSQLLLPWKRSPEVHQGAGAKRCCKQFALYNQLSILLVVKNLNIELKVLNSTFYILHSKFYILILEIYYLCSIIHAIAGSNTILAMVIMEIIQIMLIYSKVIVRILPVDSRFSWH
jgi:hypothetical protein